MGVPWLQEFVIKLKLNIRRGFKALDNTEKASFVLGCELWMEIFNFFVCFSEGVHNQLVGGYKEAKLYGDPSSTQLQSQASAGDPKDGAAMGGREEISLVSSVTHAGRVTTGK